MVASTDEKDKEATLSQPYVDHVQVTVGNGIVLVTRVRSGCRVIGVNSFMFSY